MILLAGVAVVSFVNLGGLADIEVKIEQTSDYRIAGKMYEGLYKSDELEKLFFQARDLAEKGTISSTLTVVNYPNTSDNEKYVKQFIGVLLENGNEDGLPDDFEIKTIEANLTTRATITSHNLVMPNPEDIYERAKEIAQQEGKELVEFSIEMYKSERDLVVDIPFK